MYHGDNPLTRLLLFDFNKPIPENPIIAFDLTNKMLFLGNGYSHHLNPSPYFSASDILPLSPDFLKQEGRSFIQVLEQQNLDDSNRFISFKTNNAYMYGKIIDFSKDEMNGCLVRIYIKLL